MKLYCLNLASGSTTAGPNSGVKKAPWKYSNNKMCSNSANSAIKIVQCRPLVNANISYFSLKYYM